MPAAKPLVLIRGAGEHATGTAHRLFRCGLPVLMTEISQPLVVRRTVAFAAAVFAGACTVEGVVARRVDAPAVGDGSFVPVLIAPDIRPVLAALRPAVLIDARILKRDIDTAITDAPLVIGYGPGFRAGGNCHAAIETNRGHHLGRIITAGETEPETGIPGAIAGYAAERCFRAPCAGVFTSPHAIGDTIAAGEVLGDVDGMPVTAAIGGMLRGLLHSGIRVPSGIKLGDIDPRGRREYCFTLSEKTRTISGGALEAILARFARPV
ncbi:MAG TPA: selenium-dependent molybdenum cofactor biosynthesis protein YqeB [bacterium]|nr:selenium-dependent molybdenum cofactor biosynthesis protein YqeB [bacterium]